MISQQMLYSVVQPLSEEVGVSKACEMLAVARSSYYRHIHHLETDGVPEETKAKSHPRRLPQELKAKVREVLNSERFCDQSPRQVFATLLDEGVYLCDWRTMYRLLHEHDEVRERRRNHQHRQYKKPELVATAANQVWTWDITKLKGPTTWEYFFFYTVMDLFSRYVVGWMLADRESKDLASDLLAQSCEKQGIQHGQLTIHSDNGPSMTSHSVSQLLTKLGVIKSHSRPYVSNDNPFSESLFKTVKYHPQFPERFDSEEQAREFCQMFIRWYNREHYHSGLSLLKPCDVHHGLAPAILAKRQDVLNKAFQEFPQRFVHGSPSAGEVPSAVWINPPKPALEQLQNHNSSSKGTPS